MTLLLIDAIIYSLDTRIISHIVMHRKDSSFQENVPYDVAEPAASKICLFPSPFLRKSGGDDNSLHDARNFVARH